MYIGSLISFQGNSSPFVANGAIGISSWPLPSNVVIGSPIYLASGQPGFVNATMTAIVIIARKPKLTAMQALFWEHTITEPGSYMARFPTRNPLSWEEPIREKYHFKLLNRS